jgi:hypothetical protein
VLVMIQSYTSQIQDILVYDGSETDVVLNYTAVAITLTPILLILFELPGSFRLWRLIWIPLLIFLFVFQIALCIIVGCFGVSIVWSALCGFSVYLYYLILNSADVVIGKTRLLLIRFSLSSSVLLSTGLWIYYAATSDVITTVAHLCAIMLGVALAFFFDLFCPFPEYTPLETS